MIVLQIYLDICWYKFFYTNMFGYSFVSVLDINILEYLFVSKFYIRHTLVLLHTFLWKPDEPPPVLINQEWAANVVLSQVPQLKRGGEPDYKVPHNEAHPLGTLRPKMLPFCPIMSTFIRLCLIVSSFVRTMQHSYIVKLSRFSWNLWRSINAFNLNIFLLQVLKTRNTDRLLRVAFTPFFSSNPLTCQNFGVIGGNSLLAVPGVWKYFLSNVPWMQDKRHKRRVLLVWLSYLAPWSPLTLAGTHLQHN